VARFFATGYLIAAAAIRGPTRRVTTGQGSVSRPSLARTAALLIGEGHAAEEPEVRLPLDGPYEDGVFVSGDGSPGETAPVPRRRRGEPAVLGAAVRSGGVVRAEVVRRRLTPARLAPAVATTTWRPEHVRARSPRRFIREALFSVRRYIVYSAYAVEKKAN
jgi:hypothetical protein